MKLSPSLAALLLALPLAATAQTTPTKTTTPPAIITKPTAATQQVTEVTEELDPATGKVIRRTTRTTTVPVGAAVPGSTPTPTMPASTSSSSSPNDGPANDSQVSDFFRERTAVNRLSAPALLDTYGRFIEKVRNDRHSWTPTDWARAAAVMSSLNNRYEQLRTGFTLDDKLTIRSQQAEFQALRTARQISTQVSDKL